MSPDEHPQGTKRTRQDAGKERKNTEDLETISASADDSLKHLGARRISEIMTMCQHYKDREKQEMHQDYLPRQPEITPAVRQRLIRWLYEIYLHTSKGRHAVLFSCVRFMDLFLCNRVVKRGKFQLLGCTAWLIATKMLDITPASVEDLVRWSKGAFTGEDLRKMEVLFLSTIKWNLMPPTIACFFPVFVHMASLTRVEIKLAEYLTISTLFETQSFQYESSRLCAACVVLAWYSLPHQVNGDSLKDTGGPIEKGMDDLTTWWDHNGMKDCSGYELSELYDAATYVKTLADNQRCDPEDSTKKEQDEFGDKTPLCSIARVFSDPIDCFRVSEIILRGFW